MLCIKPDNEAWNLPACSKIDVLEEGRHRHLIERFLVDFNTQIIPNDRHTFVFFDDDQALLIRPETAATRLLIRCAMLIKEVCASFN